MYTACRTCLLVHKRKPSKFLIMISSITCCSDTNKLFCFIKWPRLLNLVPFGSDKVLKWIISNNGLYRPWWWWSSGQHENLLFRRSEFESRRSLKFFLNLCLKIMKINKKKSRLDHCLTMAYSTVPTEHL